MLRRLAPVIRIVPLLALLALAPPARAQGAADTLSDSTRIERWTLPNGLRVVTRSTPGARAVAITLGYRMGMDDDPSGRAGLALLLGDLAFTAPAGELPERAPEEMGNLRPLGWSYPVLRHVTLLSEVVPTDRFPVVLDQVGRRMRDLTVTEAALAAARARVRLELRQQLFGAPVQVLNHQLREISAGHTDAAMVARASGAELDKVTVREAQEALKRWHAPANAVLSLVGDFGAVDVRRLVEQRFGPMPGGAPQPEAAPARLQAVTRSLRRPGPAAGAIGVLAPALDDSAHAAFYMAAMVLGSLCEEAWNQGKATQARFQFALVDEPELFRLFPPVPEAETDPGRLVYRLRTATEQLPTLIIPEPDYVRLRTSVSTVLGGPMPPEQRSILSDHPGVLHTLARGQATCELRMGPAFWDEYRRRLERVHYATLSVWRPWMDAPEHEVVLLMTPNPR